MNEEPTRIDGQGLPRPDEPGSDARLSDDALEKIELAKAQREREDDDRRSREETE